MADHSGEVGFFIETANPNLRFGTRWVTEAGPFKSAAEAHAWMIPSNRAKLIGYDQPYRVVYFASSDEDSTDDQKTY